MTFKKLTDHQIVFSKYAIVFFGIAFITIFTAYIFMFTQAVSSEPYNASFDGHLRTTIMASGFFAAFSVSYFIQLASQRSIHAFYIGLGLWGCYGLLILSFYPLNIFTTNIVPRILLICLVIISVTLWLISATRSKNKQ